MPIAVSGREREMALLRDVLVTTVRSSGAIVLLEGEAGIGKTLLCREIQAVADAKGFLTLYGRADGLTSRAPLSALLDCLESNQAAAEVRHELAGILRRTFELGSSEGPEYVSFAAGEALIDFLSGVAVSRPIALIVDDLQWADQASLQALVRATRLVLQLPIALFLAARPAPRTIEFEAFLSAIASRGAVTERLAALPENAVADLVHSRIGKRPGPRLREQLRQCGGNPLYLTVTLDALVQSGAVDTSTDEVEIDSVGPGSTLPVTILQNLRFCAPSTVKLLALAAVAGRTFTAAELAAAANLPVQEILPAMQDGISAGILAEADQGMAFKHDVIRDALYFDLPATVRDEIHLVVARALKMTGQAPSRVAEHLMRCSAASSVELLQEAAVDVVRGAPTVAADLLEAALSRASRDERGRILPDLAVALILAGRSSDGIELSRKCLDLGLRPSIDESLTSLLANELTAKGDVKGSLDVALAGLADAGTPAAQRHNLEGIVAMNRFFLGDLPGGAEAASQGILHAREQGDRVGESRILGTIALIEQTRGRFAPALEAATESVRLAELEETPEVLHHVPHAALCSALLEYGRLEDSLATARRGLRLVERLAVADTMVWMQSVIAYNLLLSGSLSEADAEAEAALEMAKEAKSGWRCFALAVRALVALHRDLPDAARAFGAEMEQDLERVGPGGVNMLTTTCRAKLVEATGQPALAFQVVHGTWQGFSGNGVRGGLSALLPCLAELAVLSGETEGLPLIAAQMQALASDNPGAAYLAALAGWATALSERAPDRVTHALDALPMDHHRLDWAILASATGRALATWDGHASDAAGVLLASLEAFENIGAVRYASNTKSLLRTLGVTKGARGKRARATHGWESLTETERKIVRLVTERLSNPQIADRLVVSVRTVETHVSHCLTKLGLSSRTELAARAAEHFGWIFAIQGPGPQGP
jgi:DNA-binding CsgD family transcriptional regulator/tetratricopeptide (TPR) repeat protein